MFRKFLIFALFATACGYVFAADSTAQYDVWPAPGSEADIQFYDSIYPVVQAEDPENVRIVSKIGADLVVENNFNLGGGMRNVFSGGADMTHPFQAPAGFNMFEGRAEMPLMHAEMLEDDGSAVLAMSRSDRGKITKSGKVKRVGNKRAAGSMDNITGMSGAFDEFGNETGGISLADVLASNGRVFDEFGDEVWTGAGPIPDDIMVGSFDEFGNETNAKVARRTLNDVMAGGGKLFDESGNEIRLGGARSFDDSMIGMGGAFDEFGDYISDGSYDEFEDDSGEFYGFADEERSAPGISNYGEIEVEESMGGAMARSAANDQVRSWVVASGQTLRSILQEWSDKEGWDLVWSTAREYPIQASAVFKGRFMDVASALVRNFSRADPVPYAKFFKGNRVLVVTTNEE
ncbi:MAG: toxin co-regulated pilus biosynthesis Q family protein [Alphaproteobacteria bacterium]|nr:toxin co-regulated pilus biosynthesis Q family protein [Alphaproteobacteria bacterium]